MALNRFLQIRIAHISNVDAHSYESGSNERVEFNSAYTYADPGDETREGTVEFLSECSLCGDEIPLDLNLQSMVHYPADAMARHPEMRASLANDLRPSLLFWIGAPIIAILVLFFPATLSALPPDAERSFWSGAILWAQLGLCIYLAVKIRSEWTSALFLNDRKLILDGTRDLLVAEKVAKRRKLPRPDWSETLTVMRGVSMIKTPSEHRLMSFEPGDLVGSDGDSYIEISSSEGYALVLHERIKNQFDGQAVELGVIDHVRDPYEPIKADTTPTPFQDRAVFASVMLLFCVLIALIAAVVAWIIGLERSAVGVLADFARNWGVSETFVVLMVGYVPPALMLSLLVFPKAFENKRLKALADPIALIGIIAAVVYVFYFWFRISPWYDYHTFGDVVKTLVIMGAWTLVFYFVIVSACEGVEQVLAKRHRIHRGKTKERGAKSD